MLLCMTFINNLLLIISRLAYRTLAGSSDQCFDFKHQNNDL